MAWAQPNGSVVGIVIGADGDPVADVPVRLIREGMESEATTRTASDGTFRFENLDPGEYVARSEDSNGSGFGDVAVFISSNRTSRVTILEYDAVGTVAFWQRNRVRNEALPADPWKVLDSTPGVLLDRINVGGNESGFRPAVSILGGSFQENTYLVDGLVINDDTALAGAPPYYDADPIRSVQVMRGNSSAEYSTGGVVGVLTMRGTNRFRGSGYGTFFSSGDFDSGFRNVGGTNTDSAYNFGGQVGGPIVQDSAWFFASASRERISRNVFAAFEETEARFRNSNVFAHLNARLNAGHRFGGFFGRSYFLNPGDGSSLTRARLSTWEQHGRTHLFNGRYTGMFSSNFMLEASGGCMCAGLDKEPLGTGVPSLNAAGIFNGSFFRLDSDRKAPQFDFKVGYDARRDASSHQVRAGFSYRRFSEETTLSLPFGTLTAYQAGSAFPLAIFPADRSFQTSSRYRAGFGQYTYFSERVTARIAARYDVYEGGVDSSSVSANRLRPGTVPAVSLPGNDVDLDWTAVSPRFSMDYDLLGDGRAIWSASWGKSLDRLPTEVLIYGHPFINDPYRGAEAFLFTDTNNDGAYTAGEPAGSSQFFEGATGSQAFRMPDTWVAPGLEGPTEDTFTTGFGYELNRRTTLDVTYIRRTFDRLRAEFDYVDGDAVGPGDYVGGNVVTGSDLDGDPFVLTTARLADNVNLQGSILKNYDATRTYNGVQFTFNTRYEDRWTFRSEFLFADSKESVPSDTFFDGNDLRGTFDNDGAKYGQLSPSVDKADVFVVPGLSYRVASTYRIGPEERWGFNVSAAVNGRKGYLKLPYVSTDPGDSRVRDIEAGDDAGESYDGVNVVNLRLSKKVSVGNGHLMLELDTRNVLGSDTTLQENVRLNDAALGVRREVLSPRAIGIGGRFSF